MNLVLGFFFFSKKGFSVYLIKGHSKEITPFPKSQCPLQLIIMKASATLTFGTQ